MSLENQQERVIDSKNDTLWEGATTITPEKMLRLNDPKCKHEFVRDETDENENWYAETCKFCILGRLVKK